MHILMICVLINEIPKFLADSSTVTSDYIQLHNPLNVIHLLIILFEIKSVTACCDKRKPSIQKYGDEDIPTS